MAEATDHPTVIKRNSSTHNLTESHLLSASPKDHLLLPYTLSSRDAGGKLFNVFENVKVHSGPTADERDSEPPTTKTQPEAIEPSPTKLPAPTVGIDGFVAESLLAEFDDFDVLNVSEKRPLCEKSVVYASTALLAVQLAALLYNIRSNPWGSVFVPFVVLGMWGAMQRKLWPLVTYMAVYSGRTLSILLTATKTEIPALIRGNAFGALALLGVMTHVALLVLVCNMVLFVRRDIIKRCHA
eukprot:c8252_g1_i1.p1 GENE.c8252_g1_i1~~c8252_g1_i1.p1  ORF type:complete len:241 (+),score=48.06 c8252_g1_i1:101-823(+)